MILKNILPLDAIYLPIENIILKLKTIVEGLLFVTEAPEVAFPVLSTMAAELQDSYRTGFPFCFPCCARGVSTALKQHV